MLGESHSTAWERWQSSLQSKSINVQWAWRNFLRWNPGPYQEKPARSIDFSSLPDPAPERAQELMARYALEALPQRASYSRVMETLTYLDWLDGMAQSLPEWFAWTGKEAKSAFRWLDVGSKNWAYVEALNAFAKLHFGECSENFQLDGVEIDPHRRYSNWQTRGQAAQSFIGQMPHATYHQSDIQEWQQPAQVISLFLPFVFKEPHLAWGLPLDYFKPQAVLEHVLQQLEPGGLLIIVNQGTVEAQAQDELFRKVQAKFPIEIKSLGQLPAPFIEYRYPRLGWLCRKAD